MQEAVSTRPEHKRAETVPVGGTYEGYTVLAPLKAIREKCVDCMGGQRLEVKRCGIASCPLYPYRTGHRPRAE